MPDAVTLTVEEYEDLIDARDAALALRDIANPGLAVLTESELDDYLDAPSPLCFWRQRKGLSPESVAGSLGVEVHHYGQIELGSATADIHFYARAAKLLGVRMEDLVPEA